MQEATVPVCCPHHGKPLVVYQEHVRPESAMGGMVFFDDSPWGIGLPAASYVARCPCANGDGACGYELALPTELVTGEHGVPEGNLAAFSLDQLRLGQRHGSADQQAVWQQALTDLQKQLTAAGLDSWKGVL